MDIDNYVAPQFKRYDARMPSLLHRAPVTFHRNTNCRINPLDAMFRDFNFIFTFWIAFPL